MKWKKFDAFDCILIMGKVRHSYSSSTAPLKPWALLKLNGSVICGHCTCMAGQGETCSHVGAILYWLETRVRVREQTACTSQENTWMAPTAMKDAPYLRLNEIDFTTAEKKMKGHKDKLSFHHTESAIAPPTDDEMSHFLLDIQRIGKKANHIIINITL